MKFWVKYLAENKHKFSVLALFWFYIFIGASWDIKEIWKYTRKEIREAPFFVAPFLYHKKKEEQKKRFSVVKYVFKQHDCRDKLRTNKFMRNKNF